MKKQLRVILLPLLLLAFALEAGADSLPSWKEGPSKQSIVSFVAAVTDPSGEHFVPEAERIAVFDNDGTLWTEQPMYFQLFFAIDRVRAMAETHPEWRNTQPFQAVLENDRDALLAAGREGLLKLVMASHAGNTTGEFAQIVKDWLATAKHPKYQRPYTELVFQPMLELLDYLRSQGFMTYIVSGGGVEFMRPWTEAIYGIPPEQVVGSSIKTELQMREGQPVLVRLPEMDFIDDKAGKPVGINKFIGRRPVFAFGNSDGDLQMLQWTAAGEGLRFMGLVHHTDGDREYAYDRAGHVGRLDAALNEAKSKDWTVVDMKSEWRVVYPQAEP